MSAHEAGLSPRNFPRWVWWALLVPIVAMMTILASSIQAAGWVGNSLPLLLAMLAGLAVGLGLAWTRWRWPAALAHNLAVCAGALLLLVARVPPLERIGSLPVGDFFWLMNQRLMGLLERIVGWGQAFFSGGSVRDADAFVLLVGGGLWCAGAWLGWCVLRRRRALPGVLPLGFLLALNVYLNQEAATTMLGFLICALVLVAVTNWMDEQRRWMAAGVDYSEDLGFAWGLNTVALTVLLTGLMWGATLLGTPQGWEALSKLLHRTEQEVGDPAGRIFAGVSTPEASDGTVSVKRPDLAQIGEPINRDQAVVMWVNVSDAIPLPAEVAGPDYQAPPVHYWRSSIYAAYNGRGWDLAPTDGLVGSKSMDEAGSGIPAGRYRLVQTFRIEAKHDAALFAVGEPVGAPEGGALRSAAGGSTLLEGNLSTYQVISWATRVSAADLEGAGTNYPEEVRAVYLQLPDSLTSRVRELAARVTRGAETPYEKALRIEAYLRANYQYDPYVSTPPEGRDAVDYFLFDAPGGFCTYYASAMTVMLRAEGVPARVASGYLMGEYDRQEGAYRVQGAASHTWVEVYFPGYGWVEFEPTSAFSRIVYPGEAEAVPQNATALPALEEFPGLRAALWTAGILAALAVLWVVLARLGVPGPAVLWRRYRETRAAHLPGGLYTQMRRELSTDGVPAQAGDTPYEFLAAVEGAKAVKEQSFAPLRAAAREVTEVYVQAQFSPRAPEARKVQAARRAWRGAWKQRLKLRLKPHHEGTKEQRNTKGSKEKP